jgi:hypothetical protein
MKNIFTLLFERITRKNDAEGKPLLVDGKPVEERVQEKIELDGNTEVMIGEKKMRLNDLGTAWMEQTAAATGGHNHMIDIEAYEGLPPVRVEIATLKESFNKCRKNEADCQKKEAEAAAEKDRLNAAETKRKNELFETLQRASRNGQPIVTDAGYSTSSGSLRDKCAEGAKRY